MLWNLECPVGLSQREICAHFNEGNGIGHRVKVHSERERGETSCFHYMGYSLHRQDSTYQGLCYTSRGALE